jgi:GntR family transcriptional regulator
MRRTLRIDTQSAMPIWSQIEEGVRHLVAAAALEPGTAVPSVRDLARELRVNPATVSKAYQRLTDAGVLEVKRGEGTFVAANPPAMPPAERERIVRNGARRFIGLVATLGLTRDEALAEIGRAFGEIENGRKGRQP